MTKPRKKSDRDALLDHLVGAGISAREITGGLTTKLLRRLPPPPDGRGYYDLPDRGPNAVAGLSIRRGRKDGVTFFVRADLKPDGAGSFVTARMKLGRWGEEADRLSLKAARDRAAAAKAEMRAGIDPRRKTVRAKLEAEKASRPPEVTLRAAYKNYLMARTGKKRKPLSPTTKADYDRVIERALIDFVDKPLRELAEDPQPLIEHFDHVSQDRPAEANTRMRVLRAVWNRAHKVMPAKVPLPPAIFDLNEVEARNAGFVTKEMPALWKAIEAIKQPLRKKAILTYLFLGLRDGAVLPMRKTHIDRETSALHIPYTKGKRLKLPLSPAALSLLDAPLPESLVDGDNPFMFPSLRGPRVKRRKALPEGEIELWTHVDNIDCSDLPTPAAYVEQRGDDARCHPHVFRHTYRTLATSADVADVAIRLLMGHSLKGDVSFDYLTADLEWLRAAQEKVSVHVLKTAGMPPDFRFPLDYFIERQSPLSLAP